MPDQAIPLKISIAPFPEGFKGDMDETFQQACILMSATVEGAFLTGLILPPGSTLPTVDSGPIAMGGVWYFWDPVTQQYLPQSISARAARNYAKNGSYQIRQTGDTPALSAGITKIYDMALTRMTASGILTIAPDPSVPIIAGTDYDTCSSAIKYTVSSAFPTLAAADLFAHEHLIEGSDLAAVQGEILSLSFLCWVNQPGTYSCYLTSGTRDESYCATFTISAANTWTRVKIQGIPAIPTGSGTWNFGEGQTGMYIGVVMALGSQWQTAPANLNKWNSGFFGGSTIGQTNMVSVLNNQMKITAMRLEASPQCGFAVINSFETDYHDCIRYYFTSFTYQSNTAGIAMDLRAPSNGTWAGTVLFPRRMAKVPTVTPFGYSSHASGQITDMSASPVADVPVATLAATAKGVCDSQNAVISTTGNTAVVAITGTTTLNSSQITALTSTASLSAGMSIAGSGIPPGTFIDTIVSGTVITISKVATFANSTTFSFGNFSITGIPSTTGMKVGQPISGSGIPAGATIASIVSGSAITISAATVGWATGITLIVSLVSKGDVIWAHFNADARLS